MLLAVAVHTVGCRISRISRISSRLARSSPSGGHCRSCYSLDAVEITSICLLPAFFFLFSFRRKYIDQNSSDSIKNAHSLGNLCRDIVDNMHMLICIVSFDEC